MIGKLPFEPFEGSRLSNLTPAFLIPCLPASTQPRPPRPHRARIPIRPKKILDLLKVFTSATAILGPDVDLQNPASVDKFLTTVDQSPAAKSLLASFRADTAFGSLFRVLNTLSRQSPSHVPTDPSLTANCTPSGTPYLRAATKSPPKPLSRLPAVSFNPQAPPASTPLPRFSRKLEADLRYVSRDLFGYNKKRFVKVSTADRRPFVNPHAFRSALNKTQFNAPCSIIPTLEQHTIVLCAQQNDLLRIARHWALYLESVTDTALPPDITVSSPFDLDQHLPVPEIRNIIEPLRTEIRRLEHPECPWRPARYYAETLRAAKHALWETLNDPTIPPLPHSPPKRPRDPSDDAPDSQLAARRLARPRPDPTPLPSAIPLPMDMDTPTTANPPLQ